MIHARLLRAFYISWAVLLVCTFWQIPGALAHPTLAATIATRQDATIIRQDDLNGDGQPDVTVISASFATDHDQVLVYDGGHDMREGSDWHTVTDFHNDTWVFDRGSDGSAQLVIVFMEQADTIKASLYTDQNDDGIVATQLNNTKLKVIEPLYAPLIATVQGDWHLPDGRLNWNVRFETDGPILHLHTYNIADIWNSNGVFILDGKPDVELEFRDQNHDGTPEYGVWRVVAPTRADMGAPRTWVWSNEDRHQPSQPEKFVFWPYISTETLNSAVVQKGIALPEGKNYFDEPPIISISFNAARILGLGFSGYPIEQGYHVNTLQSFQKGQSNYADFENMQAYYDLAGDKDGLPELHIRSRYFGAYDLYNGSLSIPTNEMRYSWNQTNDPSPTWEYKLGLAGRHEITTEVSLPDFSFFAIPYNDLPAWTTHNSWDYATFVAKENNEFFSTEGIYSWAPLEVVTDGSSETTSRYLAGDKVFDIKQVYQHAELGFRAELAPNLQGQARLYFSPVDRKLHLLKASHGNWKIDEETELWYTNLDGDAYLDQWRFVQTNSKTQVITQSVELDVARSHLIYSSGDEVVIRPAQVAPSLFETLAPADHAEWQALGSNIRANQRNFAPGDLKAMLEQFDGPDIQIRGATLRDYRPSEKAGFRFVLTLQPGFTVQGEDLLGLQGHNPGAYVVSYDGAFHVEPLTPAAIAVALPSASYDLLRQNTIQVQARNNGGADLPAATLELWAAPPQGQATLVTSQTLALLAQTSATATLQWAPNRAGQWTLTARVVGPDGQALAQQDLSAGVPAPAPIGVEQLLDSSNLSTALPFVALIAGAFSLILALSFRRQLPAATTPQVDDAS